MSNLSHRRILIVFSGLMLGLLLAALDQTIVATALLHIVSDLGGVESLSWVVTAYMLAATVSLPLYGKIGDTFGRKQIFQAAIVVFLVGSALSGVAQNMGQLVASRAIQGLGAGGLISLTMAIVGDILSPRERGRYQGYLGGVFAFASVVGPLLGGFFSDNLSWRWVFYINLPIGLVALLVTSFALDLPFERRAHDVDFVGAGLLAFGATSLLLVLVWGGSTYPWSSALIVGLLVTASLALGLFVLQEKRASEPILPLHLFGNSIFTVGSALGFAVGIVMFGAIVYLPVWLQLVGGVTASSAGLLLVPLMMAIITASVTSGRLISRTGRYRIFPIIGTTLMVVGFGLLASFDADTGRAQIMIAMVTIGAGLGNTMQVVVLAIQNSVARRDLGIATSASMFARTIGGTVGIALFGAVLNNRLAFNLESAGLDGARGLPALTADNITDQLQRLASFPPQVAEAIREAVANSLQVAFLIGVPVAVAAFVLAIRLKELPLRETAHVSSLERVEAGVPAAGAGQEPGGAGGGASASARARAEALKGKSAAR